LLTVRLFLGLSSYCVGK